MNFLLLLGLLLSAFGQALLALVNLRLVRLLHWEKDLANMPLLIRQVFVVHSWFISITLMIFAVLSARFYQEILLGAEPIYRWLAAAIGCFWAIRAFLQVFFYSSLHWKGDLGRTVVHGLFLCLYGIWALLYLTIAFLPATYR